MKTIATLILSLFALQTLAQLEALKRYGGSDFDYAEDMIITQDGGYLVAGATSSFDLNNSQGYAIKLDSLGNIEWETASGGTEQERFFHVTQVQDGGYLLLGTTNSYGFGGYDLFMVKLSASGNQEWEHTYGYADWDFGFDAIEVSSNEFIIVGESISSQQKSGWALKINTNNLATPIWEKHFNSHAQQSLRSIAQNQLGKVLAVGSETDATGLQKSWAISLNPTTGNLINEVSYGDTLLNDFADVISTHDSNFVVVGTYYNPANSKNAPHIVKFDQDLNLIYQDKWTNGLNAQGKKIIEGKDRKHYFIGENDDGGWKKEVFVGITQVNSGVFEGGNFFGEIENDWAKCIVQRENKNITLLGNTENFGAVYTDILVVFADSTGKVVDKNTADLITNSSSIILNNSKLEQETIQIRIEQTNNRIHVKNEYAEKLQLFNLSGQLIEEALFDAQNVAYYKHHNGGIYFYRILTTDQQAFSGKLIIQH